MTHTLALPARPEPLRVTGGFTYDRPVPSEWTARLREQSPVSDAHGYLQLVWEAGDLWRPVQRWMLYEVLNPASPVLAAAIDPVALVELRGPHPRSEGHICTDVPTGEWAGVAPKHYQPCLCRHKTETWRRGPCSAVTLTQWKLYQETGLVGYPFWTIQGRNGGHKFVFTHQESLLLGSIGMPEDAPAPGSLPYAPFDNRVLGQIAQFNRLWQWNNNLHAYRQAMSAEGYGKVRSEGEKELRKQLVAHLADQMQEANAFFVRGAKNGEADNSPRTRVNYEKLADLSEAAFIETGNILHESAVL